MWFIGDVHCKFNKYMDIISSMDESIQVGDFGIGFHEIPYPESYNLNHKFIRGNHDNPTVCRNHPNFIKDGELYKDIFCVGGAFSVDYRKRNNGIDWWEDEEVSYSEASVILETYENIKPLIVVTHDCPEIIMEEVYNKTKTRQLLNAMFEVHKPDVWIFGHHHISIEKKINKTYFKCLNELEIFKL